jgi:hypothetical protein
MAAMTRQQRDLLMLTVALLYAAVGIAAFCHAYWPSRDCIQVGEYTCVERLP